VSYEDLASKKELRGIGGWLLLFILTRTVLGPPWNGWRLFQRWEELRGSAPEYAAGTEFATLQTVSWATFALASVASFLAGIMMWKWVEAKSVEVSIWVLWLFGPMLAIAGHFVALFLVDEEFVISDFKAFLIPVASASIWTAYLLKSVRVKNTYGFEGLRTSTKS
jgi:Protein of unknown function (DUF2569)